MVRRFLLVLVALAATTLARAGEDRSDTLRRVLEDTVARNNWQAADRAYHELVDGGVRPTARDHLLGARAARALGQVNDALDRLERAEKLDREDSDVAEAMAAIRSRYGAVKLKSPGSWEGTVSLRPRIAVVDPELRLVIDNARKALERDHTYKGLLPIGAFSLGATEIDVRTDATAKGKFVPE